MRRQNRQEPDDDKLRELIIYIATLSGNDPKFDAVKLKQCGRFRR